MTDSTKRDNSYWLNRLERDGRDDLLKMIDDGVITVYRATIDAKYRSRRSAPSKAEQLDHHWKRASRREKQLFVARNFGTVQPIVRAVYENEIKRRAQNSSE